jgi:SAM-dependent methyltransferase
MFELKNCPICQASTRLVRIGVSDNVIKEPPQNILQAGVNAVLIHVVQRDSLRLTTLMCARCNHFFATPTFDADEIRRFYSKEMYELTREHYRESEKVSGRSWAAQHGINCGSQRQLLNEEREARPALLHDFVVSSTKPGGSVPRRILDVGGMDGALMKCFSNAKRFVFDLNPRPGAIEGIEFLQTFGEIEQQEKFDLLIMSHVLEHQPDPAALVRKFLRFVASGGGVYFEVPLEYQALFIRRRGVPVGGHVGLFTASSLQRLAIGTGLSVRRVSRGVFPYGEMRIPILKLFAEKSPNFESARSRKPRSFLLDLIHDTFLLAKHRYVRGQ